MSSYQTFSIDDGDEVIPSKKKFKPEEGRMYRVSFAWWPGSEDLKPDLDAKGPKFTGAQRYYVENVGYIIYTGPEHNQFLGKSQPRFCLATVLVLWPTNSKGDIDVDRFKSGDFEVMPWVFSQDKYKAFAPTHKEFHFGTYDLKITCTDTKYQKMTFSPAKESLFRKILEGGDKYKAYSAKLLEQVKGVAESIQTEIGREYTVAQLKEKLSGKPIGATSGGSSPSMSTSDVDAALENILDI